MNLDVEWCSLKSLKQIIEENPDYKTDRWANSTVNLIKKNSEWTINDEMLKMLGNGRKYPFTIITESSTIINDKSYTHKLVYELVDQSIKITSSWLFHRSWFQNEISNMFDDKDFWV